MIAGLELPTSGEILIDGEDVARKPASQRDIAFVFQMFALYPHLNVRKNIAYPLVSQGMPRADVRRKVEEVARILAILWYCVSTLVAVFAIIWHHILVFRSNFNNLPFETSTLQPLGLFTSS